MFSQEIVFAGYKIKWELYVFKEYGLNDILKKKEKGRNKDINVKDMGNYQAMKDQMEKDKKALEIAS